MLKADYRYHSGLAESAPWSSGSPFWTRLLCKAWVRCIQYIEGAYMIFYNLRRPLRSRASASKVPTRKLVFGASVTVARVPLSQAARRLWKLRPSRIPDACGGGSHRFVCKVGVGTRSRWLSMRRSGSFQPSEASTVAGHASCVSCILSARRRARAAPSCPPARQQASPSSSHLLPLRVVRRILDVYPHSVFFESYAISWFVLGLGFEVCETRTRPGMARQNSKSL